MASAASRGRRSRFTIEDNLHLFSVSFPYYHQDWGALVGLLDEFRQAGGGGAEVGLGLYKGGHGQILRRGNEVIRRRAAGDERGVEASIERAKAPPVLHGKTEEVEVGEVLGTGERGEKAGVHQGDVVWPELVAGGGEQAAQQGAGGSGGIGSVVGIGSA